MYISFDKKKLTALIAMIVLASFLIPLPTESVFAQQLDLFAPGTPGGVAAGTAARGGSGAVKTFAKTATQGLAGLTGTFATIAMIVIVARSLASTLVTIAANALDMAFKWNTINIFANTVSSGPINLFWGYARDISNAFLILILLWIAFGIIFNLERINARKLLVRVILIGLTINFSLTLTSTIFALSNAIAQPFATQLDNANKIVGKDGKLVGGGLSIKIMEITNLQTALNAAGSDAKRLAQQVENQAIAGQATQQGTNLTPEQVQQFRSIETFEGPATQHFAVNTVPQITSEGASALGTKEAQAVLQFAVAPLAIGAIKLVGGWIAADLVSGFLQQFALGQIDQGAIGWGTNQGIAFMLNPVVGTIFLLVGAFVIGSLAILFIIRGIAIMLLAILSPFAFLAMIVPGQEKYWKMWMGKLINWSFFAPISFFLLLFTFHFGDVLQAATKADARAVEIQASLPAMFQYIILMGLLVSSLWVAKFMGITFASTLMSFGQKYATMGLKAAGGFATGGLKKAYLPMFGAMGAAAEKQIGKAPVWLQRAASMPAAGLRKVTAAGRGEALKAQKGFEGMADDELRRAVVQGFLTSADRTGAVLELAKRKKLQPPKGMPEAQANRIREASVDSIDQLQRVGGDFMRIAKANPGLIQSRHFDTTDLDDKIGKVVNKIPFLAGLSQDDKRKVAAQVMVWDKMDAGDIENMDVAATFLDDARTPLSNNPAIAASQVRQGKLTNMLFEHYAKGQFYQKLHDSSPDAFAKFMEHLQTNEGKEQILNMDSATFNFFESSAARSLGLPSLEAYDEYIPNSVLQEKMDRLNARMQKIGRQIDAYQAQPLPRTAALEREWKRNLQRFEAANGEFATLIPRVGPRNALLATQGQPQIVIPTLPPRPPQL